MLKIKDCLLIAVQQTHPRHYDDSKNVDGDIKHINTKEKQLVSKDYVFFVLFFIIFVVVVFSFVFLLLLGYFYLFIFIFLGGRGVLLLFFRGEINRFRFL